MYALLKRVSLGFFGFQLTVGMESLSLMLSEMLIRHELTQVSQSNQNCDKEIIENYPAEKINSSDQLLGLFRSQHESVKAANDYLKKAKNLWIFTKDIFGQTCARETLLANLVKSEQARVVQFTIPQLQTWLMSSRYQSSQWQSLNRILTDLIIPNQIYYFDSGRFWLYRGSPSMSEKALIQSVAFRNKVQKLGITELTSSEQVNNFINSNEQHNLYCKVVCPDHTSYLSYAVALIDIQEIEFAYVSDAKLLASYNTTHHTQGCALITSKMKQIIWNETFTPTDFVQLLIENEGGLVIDDDSSLYQIINLLAWVKQNQIILYTDQSPQIQQYKNEFTDIHLKCEYVKKLAESILGILFQPNHATVITQSLIIYNIKSDQDLQKIRLQKQPILDQFNYEVYQPQSSTQNCESCTQNKIVALIYTSHIRNDLKQSPFFMHFDPDHVDQQFTQQQQLFLMEKWENLLLQMAKNDKFKQDCICYVDLAAQDLPKNFIQSPQRSFIDQTNMPQLIYFANGTTYHYTGEVSQEQLELFFSDQTARPVRNKPKSAGQKEKAVVKIINREDL